MLKSLPIIFCALYLTACADITPSLLPVSPTKESSQMNPVPESSQEKKTEKTEMGSQTKPAEPVDISVFKARYLEDGKDPQKTVKLWFEALYLYLDPQSKPTGSAQLDVLIEQSNWKTASTTATFRERTKSKVYIFRSYTKGSTPANGYQMNPKQFELIFERTDELTPELIKVFLKSSGADNPRAIRLKKNEKTGLWQVDEFSSIYVDVRQPQ